MNGDEESKVREIAHVVRPRKVLDGAAELGKPYLVLIRDY